MILLFLIYLFLIAPRYQKDAVLPLLGVDYAHRGLFDNGRGLDENTMPAFDMAIQNGYGIELDVQLTRDGVPVVLHDKGLERLFYIDRLVKETDYADIAFLPTLQAVLKKVDAKVPVLVELKTYGRIETLCEKVRDVLRDYRGAYAIMSFHPLVLFWFRRNAPDTLRGQLSRSAWLMLGHVFSRPDLAVLHIGMEKGLPFFLLTRVLRMPTAAWTITTPKQRRIAQARYNLHIFEQTALDADPPGNLNSAQKTL